MLARKCSYALQSDAARHVNITINPCCTINVEIPDEKQHIASELDCMHFKLTGKGILLVCNEKDADSPRSLRIHLSRQDAFELCEHIDDLIEEHEQLMSSLSY